MEDNYAVPEQAIQAFEHSTRTLVTVHDLSGELWAFLRPGRFEHTPPYCAAVKERATAACVRFDVDMLRRELPRYPAGLVKQCHAGLIEWVVPVIWDERMQAVLFAGQRSVDAGLVVDFKDPHTTRDAWAHGLKMPEPVGQSDSGMILELLRQLVARLVLWRKQNESDDVLAAQFARGRKDNYRRTNEAMNRRASIHRFVREQHHRADVTLADLAKTLHLSESRAGHAVREACGQTFISLITEARLRRAANLLRHSNLSVLEISLACGFGDPSHFHRKFKGQFKSSPHQYRKGRVEGERQPM